MRQTWMRFAMNGARVRVTVFGAAFISLAAAGESQTGVLTIEWVEDSHSFVRLFTHGAVDADAVHAGIVGEFWPTTFLITELDGGDPELGDVLIFDVLSTLHAIPVPPGNSIRVADRTSGVIAPGFYALAYIGDVPCAGVT